MTRPQPPSLATWLLERLASGAKRESLIGDLNEQFAHGRSVIWYWRQVLTVAIRTPVGLTVAVAVIPTIAFVLHDLVFQLPDNAHEATLGFFLTIAGLLCVWAVSGFLLVGTIDGVGRRIIVGAMAGMASVALLWVTFIVLNALFLDRMSYEPDRIRAFQRSGYATMREYWNHERGWGPAPLVMAVAAVVGAIAGAVRRVVQRRVA